MGTAAKGLIERRMAIWSIKIGQPPGILLAVAHFVGKNYLSSAEQGMLAQEMAKEINRIEETVGHERTLVVGDFNMNPFEDGLTSATSLHAVMTRKIAQKKQRVFQGNSYRYFYNPMWGLFGDRPDRPPGTYYHSSAGLAELFWHMIDQVLLRPDLMEFLDDLAILDRIDGETLLTEQAGVPQQTTYSDHLPLAFRLNLD